MVQWISSKQRVRVGLVLLVAVIGALSPRPSTAQIDPIDVIATWERVTFTGDSLGYGLFIHRVDSARTDQALLFFSTSGVADAWRAVVDGQHFIKVPGYGVFAITDSVRIAREVLRRQPTVLEAMDLLDQIEWRLGRPNGSDPHKPER